MEIQIVAMNDQYTHIALSGRLDSAQMPGADLRFYSLTAGRHKPALVDLSAVDFLSSLGVRMLLKSARSLQAEACALVLAVPEGLVRKVIEASGLIGILPIVATPEEGLALLAPQADSAAPQV